MTRKPERFPIRQNDTAPSLEVQLLDNDGDPVDITGYTEVEFHMKDDDEAGAKVDATTASGVSVTDAAAGKVKYDWSAGDTDTVGRFRAEFQVTDVNGKHESFPKPGYFYINVLEELS